MERTPTNLQQNDAQGVNIMDLGEHFAWVFLAVWMTIDVSAETQIAVSA